MTAIYFIVPDGYDEPTLWRTKSWDAEPVAVARRCDTPPELWALAEGMCDRGRLGTALDVTAQRRATRPEVEMLQGALLQLAQAAVGAER